MIDKLIVMFSICALCGWFGVQLVYKAGLEEFYPAAHPNGTKAGQTISQHDDKKSPIDAVKKDAVQTDKRLDTEHDNVDTTDDPLPEIDFPSVLEETMAEADDWDTVGVRALMTLWADRAPVAAFDWVVARLGGRVPASLVEAEALRLALSKYLDHDIDAAGQAIQNLPESVARTRLVFDYVRELGTRNSPASAHRWVATIRDPDDRKHGLLIVAQVYAEDDPFHFLHFIEESEDILASIGGAHVISDLMRRAAYTIGEEILFHAAPEEIIAGAKELSQYPKEIQSDIAEGMISRLISKNPEAIGEFMSCLPQGHFRDESIQRFVTCGGGQNPQDYWQLVNLTASIENGYKKSITAATLIARLQLETGTRLTMDHGSGGDNSVTNRLMEMILHNVL